jgi:hypothetical protein
VETDRGPAALDPSDDGGAVGYDGNIISLAYEYVPRCIRNVRSASSRRCVKKATTASVKPQPVETMANTREGLAAARARGRKGGRKPKLTAHPRCS